MASLVKRNGTYYLQWYVGKKIRRRTLRTNVHQIAKEKLRQFESAQLRGLDDPLPTRTPIANVVSAYVEHIRHVKTPKSAQTDVYYLREAFGPICPALEITSPQGTRYDPDNFSADLRDANRAACLAWSCLDFRHTFGSHLAQRGVSLYKIGHLMGNSPEICRTHYASLARHDFTADVQFPVADEGPRHRHVAG